MRMAQPLLDEVGIQHVNVTSRIRHSEIVWGKVVLEEREREVWRTVTSVHTRGREH